MPSVHGVAPSKKKRFGVFKIIPGATQTLRFRDGIDRIVTTRERRECGDVKTVAVCIKCQKEWPNEKELLAAHPSDKIMQKQEEAHPYLLPILVEHKETRPDKDGKPVVQTRIEYDLKFAATDFE